MLCISRIARRHVATEAAATTTNGGLKINKARLKKFSKIKEIESEKAKGIETNFIKDEKPLSKCDKAAATYFNKRYSNKQSPLTHKTACQFIAALRSQGLEVGPLTYLEAVNNLRNVSRSEDPSSFLSFRLIIEDMVQNNISPTTQIYSTLIKYYKNSDEIVNQVLENMNENGVEIDAHIWDALIAKSAHEGDAETAWDCMKMMIRQPNLQKSLVPVSLFESLFSLATDFESQVRCLMTMQRFYGSPPEKEFVLRCIWNHTPTIEAADELLLFCSVKKKWFVGKLTLFRLKLRLLRFRDFLEAKSLWQSATTHRDANSYSVMIVGVATFMKKKDDGFQQLLEQLVEEASDVGVLDQPTLFHVVKNLTRINSDLADKYRPQLTGAVFSKQKLSPRPWSDNWRPLPRTGRLLLSRDGDD
eukprot:TRINITY_DN18687_c0_g1_i1.p1 TRINITY_DN18687_c0_g1~~TRINITY_DN18687_c0_g1_i1.p1  ORF type:complete len:417 (+),score=63.57 TRINITY_DN18687_c0_g1_i1:304-1554(+)